MGRLDQGVLDMLAPDNEGTVRHNHYDCPAGTDTKRRLYVTRKEDGVIVGYCHNCGGSGVSVRRRTHHRRGTSDRPMVSNATAQVICMPPNVELDPNKWPKEALDWVNQSGIPLTLLQEYAFAYDKDYKRVIIPKYNLDNELVMYQSRNVGLDDGPKYVTVRRTDGQVYSPIGCGSRTVVLCEDMLSAIKLTMCGVDAIPLYSSNVEYTKLLTSLSQYDIIIVWLDNDNVEVNRHRDKLVSNSRLIGKESISIDDRTDPKLCTVKDINFRIGICYLELDDVD